MPHKILILNPGSTSTKIALYRDTEAIATISIQYTAAQLVAYPTVLEQLDFRKNAVLEFLSTQHTKVGDLDLIMSRGGLLRPVQSGVYAINEEMLQDLRSEIAGAHAANLGALIAHELAREVPGMQAYIADPVVVDEFQQVARFSGHKLFQRRSVFHALNQKAVAREYAQQKNCEYEDLNLIVAHLGGGVSVGAHRKGKVVDANQALDGEGPMSPERSGTLPTWDLVELCYSGKYPKQEVKQMIIGKGGWVSHLGTNSAQELIRMKQAGNTLAAEVLEAFAYQVSKYIGAMATVLEGKVDAVLLTGGLAFADEICSSIRSKVQFVAELAIFAGENEMRALAQYANWVLEGNVQPQEYGNENYF